ncbi:cell division protein ZapA [Granulicella sp. WH15]|nr:cell division protein ZapA [Granulicella sp. WH15]QHN05300.1 cell division protein ZapA [Granulicella sp. WH15]
MGEDQARADAVSVEIYDQVYHLRGTDPAYIQHLASIVDAKMRAVSALGATVDSLRVAVLASLNIADELAVLRARHDELASAIAESQSSQTTMRTLSGMLDELLDAELEGREARRAG